MIDCKHYNYGDGNCPFGTSCFYKHADRNGIIQDNLVRVVKGYDEDVKVVGSLKLSDYLDKYEQDQVNHF